MSRTSLRKSLSWSSWTKRAGAAATAHTFQSRAGRKEWWHAARIALIVALASLAGARLGFTFGFPSTKISIFWLPNVVLIAALWLTPRRWWWVVIGAGLLIEVLSFPFAGAPLHITAMYYAGNAGQALLSVILLQRLCGGAPRFDTFVHTAWFVAIAVFFAPAVMSFLLDVALAPTGWLSDGWTFWQARFLTDALTTLAFAPPVLTLLTVDRSRLRRLPLHRYLEASALICIFIAVGTVTLSSQLPALRSLAALMYYLPLPLFLWAGVRFGVNGVSASLLITSVLTLWSASRGEGPFAGQPPADSVLQLQLFLITIGSPLMLMAALIDERRSTIKSLREGNVQIHQLASALITAQEEERRRIARELHDEVGQALTAVKINLEVLRMRLGAPDAQPVAGLLEESVMRADDALDQVRDLSLLLRPAMLDDLGLTPALRWLANTQAERAGYHLTFTAAKIEPRPAREIETVFYRVAQEALTNVARYAEARNVFIRVQVVDRQLRMTLRDDGVGFDVAAMRERAMSGSSMGLLGMEERARLVGGQLTIHSLPGRGTTVELSVPYVAAPEHDDRNELAFQPGPKQALSEAQPALDADSHALASPMQSPASTLLKTKFNAPRADRRWIARPRLLDKLGKRRSPELTLIVAPAGFGKTTLIGQWLARCSETSTDKRAVAWLSLEASDNAPERFFSYLVAAIRDAAPAACSASAELTSSAPFPPIRVVTETLLDDLSVLSHPLTIVLDDYHAITDDAIHAAMEHILDRLPAGINVIVASREATPWVLSDFRAAGRVVEMGVDELAFTLDEARALLDIETSEASDAADKLHQRTEGWPLGLQLVRLTLCDQPDPLASLEGALSADRYVTSYLVEEVLARQPQDIQDFLMLSAVPNRFCPSLCDALRSNNALATRSSADMLVRLEQRNLFLVPLDDEHTWYRYHHLFRDALLQRLQRTCGTREVQRLNLAASDWFEAQGLLEEAVHHAVQAGQPIQAARIVERHAHALIEQALAFAPAVQSLLARVPSGLRETRPILLAIQAFLAYSISDMSAMTKFVARADSALAQPPTDMSAEDIRTSESQLDWLRGITLFAAGDPAAARASSSRALQHLPATARFERTIAQSFEAISRALLGETHAARESLADALAREADPAGDCANWLIGAACRLELHTGNLDRALHFAARLAEPHPGKSRYWIALGHNVLGRILHDRWDLDAAAEHHEQVIGHRYGVGQRNIYESLVGLAWIRIAQGDLAEAQRLTGEMNAFARESNDPYLGELVATFEIGTALNRGDLGAALDRLGELRHRSNTGASAWRMEPHLRRAQALIARSTPQSVAEAVTELQNDLRDAERAHNAYQAMEVRALLALGLHAQGDAAAARAGLVQAIEEAAQQGCIRTFVELGAPMAALLAQLASCAYLDASATHHLNRIQAAFAAAHQDFSR